MKQIHKSPRVILRRVSGDESQPFSRISGKAWMNYIFRTLPHRIDPYSSIAVDLYSGGGGYCFYYLRFDCLGSGYSLQVWRVAASILNEQPRTADKRRSPTLGVARESVSPHRKKIGLLRNVTHPACYENKKDEIRGSCGTRVAEYECL